MTLVVFRKFAVFLIQSTAQMLYFVDLATNFDLRKLLNKVKQVVIYFSIFSFTVLLGYAFYSDFFYKVAEGIAFSGTYQGVNSIDSQKFPMLVNKIEVPSLSAKAFLIEDVGKSKILLEKLIEQRLVPASTVKLMTALVALDIYDLDEVLTVQKFCTEVEGMRAFYPEGSTFKVRDIISSMLIGSAGDSACVLANSKVTEQEFVDLMNKKAKDIGLDNSHFSNPIGLDFVQNGNYTTVRDLYKLASYSISNDFIKDAVKTVSFSLRSEDGGYSATIYNTNKLLWELPGSVGVKTGTTTDAGEVLIYEYKDAKKDLMIIVMGSEDRFYDTKSLLMWALLSYEWE